MIVNLLTVNQKQLVVQGLAQGHFNSKPGRAQEGKETKFQIKFPSVGSTSLATASPLPLMMFC